MKISLKNRKIGYTYGSTSGVYAFRSEKSIRFESLLESDFLKLMEFNDVVLDVIEQPMTIEFQNKNGKLSRYTPDFLVYFKQPDYIGKIIKPILVEVKPTNKLIKDWEELKPKFKAAVKFSQNNDYQFRIFNEKRIRSTEIENIVFLERYKNYVPNQDDVEMIINHLKIFGHTTIEYLTVHLYATEMQRGICIAHVWHLMSMKVLTTNFKIKFNKNTVIWLNTDDNDLEGENDGY